MIITSLRLLGTACPGGSFLGFPKWYAYLDSVTDKNGFCSPRLSGINDAYLIVAAVIEIMLRIAALAAVGYVIYGGIEYLTSQGESDKTAKARSTIISALVGLAISISAAAIVSFLAGTIK